MSHRRALLFAALAVVALVGALVTVTAPTASAALAPPAPTLWLQGSAQLAADGSLVVPYAYRCQPRYASPTGYAIVTLQVTQRVAHAPATVGSSVGGDAAYFVCDARWHHGRQTVVPDAGRFRTGQAFLRADILACDAAELHCVMPTQRRSIAAVRAAAPARSWNLGPPRR